MGKKTMLVDGSKKGNSCSVAGGMKGKKKGGGVKLWMRFDKYGKSEVVECDKMDIIKRVAIPAKDLRNLGPLFSQSSYILAREKAMVVNLDFIKAIVTVDEVLVLEPLRQEVVPFVDQLRQQLPHKNQGASRAQDNDELPFEFQVLEIALEVVCTSLDANVADFERNAYHVLDELARNVSTENLEYVRNLKSNLTLLLARVEKVRDEIEHLLDDDEDMANLYLTRKWIQNKQLGSTVLSTKSVTSNLRRINSNRTVISSALEENDVEDLEMLLEAYFMQLDRTRNKILSIREYIDDTEDYVNIQLDSQRNELIQFQLVIKIVGFAVTVDILVAGIVSMNIPCTLYNVYGVYGYYLGGTTAGTLLLCLLMLWYARWKKLL